MVKKRSVIQAYFSELVFNAKVSKMVWSYFDRLRNLNKIRQFLSFAVLEKVILPGF